MYSRRRKAFTLLELVVVILVVSLLAAVGLFAYRSTVDSSKDFAAQQAALTLGTQTYQPDMAAGNFAADGSSLVAAFQGVNLKEKYPDLASDGQSHNYGEYAAAITEDLAGTRFVVVVMKSQTGRCAHALIGWPKHTVSSDVTSIAPCAVSGVVSQMNTVSISGITGQLTLNVPPVSSDTSPPASPALTYTSDVGAVTLTWDPVDNADYVDVYRMAGYASTLVSPLASPSASLVSTVAGTVTTTTFNDLNSSPTATASSLGYIYYVVARNQHGPSTPSNAVKVIQGFRGNGGSQLICHSADNTTGQFLVVIPETLGWPSSVTWTVNNTGGAVTGIGSPGYVVVTLNLSNADSVTVTSQVYRDPANNLLRQVGGTATLSTTNTPVC